MEPIKAKALKKKGTDKFYFEGSYGDWKISNIPVIYNNTSLIKQFIPSDAEIVDIEIIVKEGEI